MDIKENKKEKIKIIAITTFGIAMIILAYIFSPYFFGTVGNIIMQDQDLQEYRVLDGLFDDKKLVVWNDGLGALGPSISLASVLDESDDAEKYINKPSIESNVFDSYRSENICFKKISDNTVKIIYDNGEIRKQKKKYKGINFIYEIGDCPDWPNANE